MMELEYTAGENGILYPDLLAPRAVGQTIGIWGMRRKRHLKDNRKGFYAIMKSEGTLFEYLAEIDRAADAMFDDLVSKLAKAQGVTSELKMSNQMQWVGLMNNIRHSVEEVIYSELVYS
jgi:hypothetical protein